MFLFTTTGVRIVTLAVVIAVIRVAGKLRLFFSIPSFLISVFDGFTVLAPDELCKFKFKILDVGMSDKTLVGLRLVV